MRRRCLSFSRVRLKKSAYKRALGVHTTKDCFIYREKIIYYSLYLVVTCAEVRRVVIDPTLCWALLHSNTECTWEFRTETNVLCRTVWLFLTPRLAVNHIVNISCCVVHFLMWSELLRYACYHSEKANVLLYYGNDAVKLFYLVLRVNWLLIYVPDNYNEAASAGCLYELRAVLFNSLFCCSFIIHTC